MSRDNSYETLLAILKKPGATRFQVQEALGISQEKCRHRLRIYKNKGLIDRYPDPIRARLFHYFLTSEGFRRLGLFGGIPTDRLTALAELERIAIKILSGEADGLSIKVATPQGRIGKAVVADETQGVFISLLGEVCTSAQAVYRDMSSLEAINELLISVATLGGFCGLSRASGH